MQATISIPAVEFNLDIFEKIKSLLKSTGEEAEVLIMVKPKTKRNEDREEYFSKLEKAFENVKNNRNSVNFTFEEWENEFVVNEKRP